MAKLNNLFLEPVNTLTHLLGTLIALPALALLLLRAREEPGTMGALLVYGVSMVALFGASTLLHGLKTTPQKRMWLTRLDHAAIFLLIAGTYTPVVYDRFPAGWREPLLLVVWGVALAGVVYKFTSPQIEGLLNVSIYVILGWGGAVLLLLVGAFLPAFSLHGLRWLVLGGVIYSVGFCIYYFRRPDPRPGLFGHHEIWHLCVLAGSFCHYLFMLRYVAS